MKYSYMYYIHLSFMIKSEDKEFVNTHTKRLTTKLKTEYFDVAKQLEKLEMEGMRRVFYHQT